MRAPPTHRNPAGLGNRPDVGTQQAKNLGRLPCHSGCVSDMVRAGRSQAALKTERGITPQERWSRGCRGSFWRLQLQQLLQLAPRRKKKSLWWNRFRSNRNTPASTNNVSGRGGAFAPPAPNTGPRRATEGSLTHLMIVNCAAPRHPWRTGSYDSEVVTCCDFPSLHPRFLLHWFWRPVRPSLNRSFPSPSMTSSAGLRLSASAMPRSAIRTTPCRACRAAKTVATPANAPPSPWQGSGRSARRSHRTTVTTRSAIRSGQRSTERSFSTVKGVGGLWSPMRVVLMASDAALARRHTPC